MCSNDNGKAYAGCMTCLVGASKEDIKEWAQSATDREHLVPSIYHGFI